MFGLYGAFLPVLVYALFGSCRQLGVGPVAVTSGLIFSGLNGIIPGYDSIADPNDPGEHAAIQVCYVRHACGKPEPPIMGLVVASHGMLPLSKADPVRLFLKWQTIAQACNALPVYWESQIMVVLCGCQGRIRRADSPTRMIPTQANLRPVP